MVHPRDEEGRPRYVWPLIKDYCLDEADPQEALRYARQIARIAEARLSIAQREAETARSYLTMLEGVDKVRQQRS